MNENTRTFVKKSYPAAVVGGILGYLLGAWADSYWLSFIFFFVIGYLGYDFRQTMAASKVCWDVMVEGAKEFWKFTNFFNPHPLITLPLFLLVAAYGFGTNNAAAPNGVLFNDDYFHNWTQYSWANVEWLFTGTYSELPTKGMMEAGPVFRGFYGGFVALFWAFCGLATAACVAWILKGLHVGGFIALSWSWRSLISFTRNPGFYLSKLGRAIVYPFVQTQKFFGSLCKQDFFLALRISLLILFYPTVGLVLLVSKVVVLFLKLIHSARRLATGLSTVLGGAIYMIFVPFNVPVIPLPLAALLCGSAAGCVTTSVQILLDGDRVGSWLDSFLKKPVYSYVLAFKS